MLRQLENALYVFADLTNYYRSPAFPNGFGMIFTSGDRSTAQQTTLATPGLGPGRGGSRIDPQYYYNPLPGGTSGGGAFAGGQMFPMSAGRADEGDMSGPVMPFGPLPVAPPGTSQHEYGAAFDAVPNVEPGRQPEALQAAGRIAAQCGLTWGGAADRVHFALFKRTDWQKILPAIRAGAITTRDLGRLWDAMVSGNGGGGAAAPAAAPQSLYGNPLSGYVFGMGGNTAPGTTYTLYGHQTPGGIIVTSSPTPPPSNLS